MNCLSKLLHFLFLAVRNVCSDCIPAVRVCRDVSLLGFSHVSHPFYLLPVNIPIPHSELLSRTLVKLKKLRI